MHTEMNNKITIKKTLRKGQNKFVEAITIKGVIKCWYRGSLPQRTRRREEESKVGMRKVDSFPCPPSPQMVDDSFSSNPLKGSCKVIRGF